MLFIIIFLFRKISYCKNSYFFNQYSSLSLHMLYNICNLPTRILQMKIIIWLIVSFMVYTIVNSKWSVNSFLLNKRDRTKLWSVVFYLFFPEYIITLYLSNQNDKFLFRLFILTSFLSFFSSVFYFNLITLRSFCWLFVIFYKIIIWRYCVCIFNIVIYNYKLVHRFNIYFNLICFIIS